MQGALPLHSARLGRVRRPVRGSCRTWVLWRYGPIGRSATQVNGTGLFRVTPTNTEADRMAAARNRHLVAQVGPPACDTLPAVAHPSSSVAPPDPVP